MGHSGVRIGLLGAGRIGAFHAGTLAAHPDVAELLVADADPARAREVAAAHDAVRALPVRALSVDALFAARPDAVVIASATAAHAALLVRAARAGVPAFCEKPIALDLPGTLAALTAVEESGAVLQMGFQRRFDAGYAAARQALAEGRAGRLHTVRTVSSDPAPPPPAYVPLSGGIYRDCLIHDFDILRWVTGLEVTEVYAAGTDGGAEFFRTAGDVDTAAALLTLEGGVLATATATRYHAAGYDVRMELAGTDGQLAVGVGPRAPLTSVEPGGREDTGGPGGPQERAGARAAGGSDGSGGSGGTGAAGGTAWNGFLERFGQAYRAELEVFLRVARGEARSPCGGRDALRALLVAEACEVSRRERRPVRVEEVADTAAALEPAQGWAAADGRGEGWARGEVGGPGEGRATGGPRLPDAEGRPGAPDGRSAVGGGKGAAGQGVAGGRGVAEGRGGVRDGAGGVEGVVA